MNRIREKRNELGLTQVQLALKTGLANSVISDFELEKRQPWPRARRALTRVLKCSATTLFPDNTNK